jgi:hypothetical protein
MEQPASAEPPPGRAERQTRRTNGAERSGNGADGGADYVLPPQALIPMINMLRPTMEAGLGMLEDAREFTLASAEQIEDNIRVLQDGWNDLRTASSPEDYNRIAARMSYTMTRQWADSAERVTKFVRHAASRRMRAGSAFAAEIPRADHPAR